MTTNVAKLVGVVVLALTLIVAVLIDAGNRDWAVPLLGTLIGFVVGNAEVTSRTGGTAPIISTKVKADVAA